MTSTVKKNNPVLRFFFNPLARGSAIMFTGSVLSGLLAYGLQIVLARALGVEDYGLVSSLMAVYTIVVSPLAALSLAVTKDASYKLAHHDMPGLRGLVAALWRTPLFVWVTASAMLIALAPLLTHIIKGANFLHIACLAGVVLAAYFVSLTGALVHALQRFTVSTAIGIGVVVAKIVAVVVLVWMGFRVNAVLLGFTVSSLIAAAMSYQVFYRSCGRGESVLYQGTAFHMRRLFPMLISYLSINIISQYDLLLVKYLFDARVAGEFALAAVLGKAIFVLPTSIGSAVFPIAARGHALAEDGRKTLFLACAYVFLLAAGGTFGLWLLGDFFIRLFFGEGHLLASQVIGIYGFAMIPLAIMYVIEYYYLANGKVLVPLFIFASTLLQIIALTVAHVEIITLVWMQALANLACLLLIIAYVHMKTKGTYRFA